MTKHKLRASIYSSEKSRAIDGEEAEPLIEHVRRAFEGLRVQGIGTSIHEETTGAGVLQVDITIDGSDCDKYEAVMKLEPAVFQDFPKS